MKKVGINLIVLILLGGFTFAQEINKIDAQGERTGVWKKYYPNKQLRYEGEFKNGKEIGVFKFYAMSSSKHPLVLKTYNPDLKEVKVQFFTKNGIIESEGMMLDKKRIGLWTYYHSDGKTIMIEENYDNGQLSGVYTLYYKNTQITKTEHYKNGKLHGNSKQYTTTGILTEDINYVDGYLQGNAVYYEINGAIKLKGRYKEDLKVGMWEFYVDGKLKKTKEVEKGIFKN